MAEEKEIVETEASEDQLRAGESALPEDAPVVMDEVSEQVNLRAELEAKDKAVLEGADRLKRLQADFDNFRRRTRQEKEELSAVVAQALIKDLLPLLDNFERALAAEVAQDSALKDGVQMIYKQFVTALEKNGLAGIEAVGNKFDPNFHEAIMRVADASKEDDTIAEELQKGYSVHGRVIRPSMVKVVGN